MTMEIDTAEKWKNTLNKAVQAVVKLRTTSTRTFDTEDACSRNDTGFIVDKQRGIILTTRIVIRSGPVVAEAMFYNREVLPVRPLYRDPVHDFGFFRFDPAALQFMKCEEIPLAPEAAVVGLDIRVVGNDGFDNLSIMAGTLAGLDREAPDYWNDGYNDFNTFYMQAATRVKGGSTGSPVIDCDGKAVGLNTVGGPNENYLNESSAAFFLPLDRVARALTIIQNCEDSRAVHIPRGTLQMSLNHQGLNEARRLGLQRETEQIVRHNIPLETGMLVIEWLIPGGPASAHKTPLMVGDILVRVNGQIVTRFLQLETLLDDNVGKTIDLEVERGGVPLKLTLEVQDLHSITPKYFFQVSGGVIHPLSYIQAWNFGFECGVPYVAKPGYMLGTAGVPTHAIIKKFAQKKIKSVEDFISILSRLPRGARVPLEYVNLKCRHRPEFVLITIDRNEWFPEPELYTRDDVTGLWKTSLAMSSFTSTSTIQSHHDQGDNSIQPHGHDDEWDNSSQVIGKNVSDCQGFDSIATIDASIVFVVGRRPSPALIEGMIDKLCSGTGVVIYHSDTMGIVLVDKTTVPICGADVTIQFLAYPIEIPGDVVFLHPLHNYAFVAYDPAALTPSGAAAVRAAVLLPEPALRRGDAVSLFGLEKGLQTVSINCFVTNPATALKTHLDDSCPQFTDLNVDVIELDTAFEDRISGVVIDEQSRVRALWGRFSKWNPNADTWYVTGRGIPIYAVSEVLHKIIHDGTAEGPPPLVINGIKLRMPLVRILEVELGSTLLSSARSFGLSEEWIRKLAQRDPIRLQVLEVKGCWAGSRAQHTLEEGDMLLAIDGEPITSFGDIEKACQRLDASKDVNQGNLKMTIFREGSELELLVGTDIRDGFDTKHIVGWCGCAVHQPPASVRALGFMPKQGLGVYVSASYLDVNPMFIFGSDKGMWIVEINGKPIPDLQTFKEVTQKLEDGEFVRIKSLKLNGQPEVFTVKQDLRYWPTWELIFHPETASWHRKTIKALDLDDHVK